MSNEKTTPPPDVLRSALLKCEQWNAEHGNWSEEMEEIVERALRAAERGTTPPEGLSDTMDREIAFAQRLCANKQPHDWEMCNHCHYLADSLVEWGAATQRAPVELSAVFEAKRLEIEEHGICKWEYSTSREIWTSALTEETHKFLVDHGISISGKYAREVVELILSKGKWQRAPVEQGRCESHLRR